MNNQEKNEEALKQLGIKIPEGYEFVRYGKPMKDDWFINDSNEIHLSGGSYINKFFIIKGKFETDCWYFARFEQENYPIYLSVDGDFYETISSNGIGQCKVTSEFEIISKMEAVK